MQPLIILIAISILNSSCALFQETPKPPEVSGPVSQVYSSSFEEVWRATQLAVQLYPMKINNVDQGRIETESLRGSQAWQSAHSKKLISRGFSYSLMIRVLEGRVGKKKTYKVSVLKRASRNPDFFSDEQPLPSNGFEEKTILYRIEREIQIDRALQRIQAKMNRKKSRSKSR